MFTYISQVLRKVSMSTATLVLAKPWVIPVLLSLTFSCVLIERKWGLFSESFLTKAALKLIHIPVFLLFATLIDLTLIYFVYLLWCLAGRFIRMSTRTTSLSFIIVVSTIVGVINIAHYNVIAYLGDVTRINTALNVGGGMGGALPYLMNVLPAILVYGLVIPLVGLTGYTLLRQSVKRVPEMSPVSLRKQLSFFGLCIILFLCIEVFITLSPASHPVVANLRRTCLYRIEHPLTRFLTDFDCDGYGMLDNPPDFAPFDSTRHPYALETPGNGIDANGIGGDLPRYEIPELISQLSSVNAQPDIILIMACTLRYDAVFGGDLGSSSMPNLQKLAKNGFSTNRAYSHSGFTTTSMQATLCGGITTPRRSIIQDLKDAHYQVGAFSAHDDSFGNSRHLCALDKSDRYFDASMDRDSRVTASAASSSILVSGKRIIQEATGFLESSKADQPMFLFVFFANTHYPYTHDSPQDIIPHRKLSPNEIRASSRDQIVELYRNAAANLDQQISNLLEQVNRCRQRSKPVVIVLGDHGESLFDDGMLGHGLKMNEVQTRVPLIILNGWGTVPVPFGQSDLRAYLLQLLNIPRPNHPVVTARLAERPVFQYTGSLTQPQEIGAVSLQGRTVVNVEEGTVLHPRGKTFFLRDVSPDALTLDLIHRWECFCLLSKRYNPELADNPLLVSKEKLEQLGRKWCLSGSWHQKEAGIAILHQFNTSENIEILKSMVQPIQDTTDDEYRLNTANQDMLKQYLLYVNGVQDKAWKILQEFGIHVSQPSYLHLHNHQEHEPDTVAELNQNEILVHAGKITDWVGFCAVVFALVVLLWYGKIMLVNAKESFT